MRADGTEKILSERHIYTPDRELHILRPALSAWKHRIYRTLAACRLLKQGQPPAIPRRPLPQGLRLTEVIFFAKAMFFICRYLWYSRTFVGPGPAGHQNSPACRLIETSSTAKKYFPQKIWIKQQGCICFLCNRRGRSLSRLTRTQAYIWC